MKQALVSVVIPTYNRYKYLKGCIESIITINSQELEVVIQDNSEDNTEILQFLSTIHDNRLCYYHQAEHVSVMENSDLAVKHSTGKFVCMIGDDDSVCENIIKAAEYCYKNNHDACCFVFPGFNWPDMSFEVRKKEANLFFFFSATGLVHIVNSLIYFLYLIHC